MPAVNVNIQPVIIQWVLSQVDEEKLGSKVMENIKHWLEGSKTPTFRQIEDLSRKTHIPLGYFFLQTPPVEQIQLLEYRTVDSVQMARPSRNLIDTIHEMEQIQAWMIDYRKDMGFDVLPIAGCMKGETSAAAVAAKIRNDLDLSESWYTEQASIGAAFNYVRRLLEESGIIVMLNGVVGKNTHRALDIEEFRAFAMVDEWAPLIFVNSADSQGGRLFSLFHEIAHIWIGEDDLYNADRTYSGDVKPAEVLCNAVAGELMVPEDAFIQEWEKNPEEKVLQRIKAIARFFNCGESVIARKALDHKKITKPTYLKVVEEAINAYKDKKEKRESGGNYYNTMGSRLDRTFVNALCESVQTGRTSYNEAYRLTNTSRKTFSEVVSHLGGTEWQKRSRNT